MIEIDTSIIDSELLFERVRVSVAQKQIPKEFFGGMVLEENRELSISDIRTDMVKVYQCLQMMNATWVISEQPITTQKKYIGKVVILLKKVFRKLTRWLFRTYYEQQTAYNRAATQTVSEMIKVQEKLISYCENLR